MNDKINQRGKPSPDNEKDLQLHEQVKQSCESDRMALLCELESETGHELIDQQRRNAIGKTLQAYSINEPDKAVEILLNLEKEQHAKGRFFDTAGMTKPKINRLLSQHSETEDNLNDRATAKSEAISDIQSRNAYFDKISGLKQVGKSNTEIIQILASDPTTPESEMTKLQAFAQIISLAIAPHDQQLILQKVNRLDISSLPEPTSFIRAQIFDAPDHQSGFSEAFQKSVAENFNVPIAANNTVADMERILDQKVPVINPETGKVESYRPAITRDNAIEARPGIVMYVDENGHKTYEDLYSGETFPFQGGIAGNATDKMKMQFLSSRPVLLNRGVESFFGFNLKNARMPKEHELHKMHAIQNALLGGSRSLSPDVMYANEQEVFSKRLLFLSQFGDGTPFSHPSEQMMESLRDLGVTNSADPLDVNLDALSAAGDWLNAHSAISGFSAYEELKHHLGKVMAKGSEPDAA